MKKSRKLLSALLCCALLLPTLAACKRTEEDEIPPAVQESVTNVYKGSFFSVPENILLRYYDGVSLSGNSVVMNANEILNYGDPDTGEGYESRTIYYSLPLDGGEAEILEIPRKTQDKKDADGKITQYGRISNSALGADGSMVVLEYTYETKNYTRTYLLTKYAAAGTEVYSFDPEPYQEVRTDPRAEIFGWSSDYEFYVNDMLIDAEGTLYLQTEFSLLVISNTGERMYEIPIAGYVESMMCTSNGKVLVRYTDYTDYETRTVYMDNEKKGFSDPIELPAITFTDYELHLGNGYDFYLQTDTGLYGVNAADTEPTLLCNWVNSDIAPNSIQTILVLDADTFFYIGEDPVTDSDMEIAIMKRIPDDEVPEKYLIRLAGTYFAYDFAGLIVKFNRANDQYRVVMEDYSEYNTSDDYSAGEQKLEDDILAGNAPDILYSYGYGSAYSNYADKGVFADLYELMDADDTFDRSNLLSCVLTPFETDGKLYQLATYFTLYSYIGKTEKIGQYTDTWTLENFLALLEECEDKGITFTDEMYRDNMESALITDNLASYIDYDKATCNFNTETFLHVLEFLKSLPTFDQYYENYDYQDARQERYAGLRDGKILVTNATISSFSDYLQQKAMFLMEDITLLGLPTTDGSKISIQGSTTYSISAKSSVKAGAWEFLKYLLSDEVFAGSAENFAGLDYFCATKSGLRAMAQEEMKHYYTFNLDGSGWGGTTWDGVNPPEHMEYDPDTEIPGYLTQQDADDMIETLENAEFTSNLHAGADDTLNDIIAEELGAFYAGNSTAADTANKIQSRVSIYLGERS